MQRRLRNGNSENLVFYAGPLGYDRNAIDTYIVTLSLLGANSNPIFAVSEVISATPLPAALPLFATGLGAAL